MPEKERRKGSNWANDRSWEKMLWQRPKNQFEMSIQFDYFGLLVFFAKKHIYFSGIETWIDGVEGEHDDH